MQRLHLADAESEFAFLRDLGFQRAEGWETDTGSFRDGWRLHYVGAQANVTIEYLDWQFHLGFEHKGTRTDYLFLDRELFGHRSGLHGDMFPPEKLPSVVAAVARDIRENYAAVLNGEASLWEKIRRLVQAPREKRRLP